VSFFDTQMLISQTGGRCPDKTMSEVCGWAELEKFTQILRPLLRKFYRRRGSKIVKFGLHFWPQLHQGTTLVSKRSNILEI